jgi:hypothetical protein
MARGRKGGGKLEVDKQNIVRSDQAIIEQNVVASNQGVFEQNVVASNQAVVALN